MTAFRLPMTLAAYGMVTRACRPVKRLVLKRRARAGKEDAARLDERLGRASEARPEGPLVWLHAGGIKQVEAALPLIDYLSEAHTVLVTTSSVPAAAFVASRLPMRVLHQYLPFDDVVCARRFLDYWKPEAAIWIEFMACFNLLGETLERGISTALVNARLTTRRFKRWCRIRPLVTPLLAHMDMIAAQSTHDAAEFKVLGARHIYRFGNLKYATPAPLLDQRAAGALSREVGHRPTWLAAYTHEGEEEEVAQAHTLVEGHLPGLLTVLAPRQPYRGEAIAEMLRFEGFRVARRSLGEPIEPDTQIYIINSIGDMGLLYHVAPVVLMGGSLVPKRGHNPLEAAHMGCAVLAGPYMDDFVEPTAELKAAGGVQTVNDAATLASALSRLLKNPSFARQRGVAARRVAQQEWVALGDLIATLAPLLPAAASPERAMIA